MSKLLGYLIAVGGLAVLGLSLIAQNILPAAIQPYSLGVGVVVIVVGLFLSMSGSSKRHKEKQAESEVPIYQGEGKNRKIVGYKREK